MKNELPQTPHDLTPDTQLLSIQVAVETQKLNDPEYVKAVMSGILETAQSEFLKVMPEV